jgi:hypothetical protein
MMRVEGGKRRERYGKAANAFLYLAESWADSSDTIPEAASG